MNVYAGKSITAALAGNPNSGKTTLFNAITGAHQHVGNYPGVTVEKKEGRCRTNGVQLTVVDLPGTYSLTAYSTEEIVARDFVIKDKPDVVVDVVDASNLERNLYLAVQLIELGAPLVLAFNMSDVAKSRGFEFDIQALSRLLGAPIVLTSAHKSKGVEELLETILKTAEQPPLTKSIRIQYGSEIEAELAKLQRLIEAKGVLPGVYAPRWLALKLLEQDREISAEIHEPELLALAKTSVARLTRILGDSPEMAIADRRYGFISGACQETVRSTVEQRHYVSDQIDAVLAHRILGLPIFLLMMYLVFEFTFTLGNPAMGAIEHLFSWLADTIIHWWPRGSESALRSLLVDGVIGGVGGVIVFLPNILLLFLSIALLEDSGYMARAAFVMDHIMHKFDLHGKSFIPMMIGFGCTVPAIMATRTLENERDRLTTMLVAPLMSCGARFPIYALLIPAFFPKAWQAPMLWLIYFIGIVLALALAKLLRLTLFRGESTPFVMELPPYRMPTARGALHHMWGRGWLYVRKAGTVILAISILLWVLTAYPKKTVFDLDYNALKAGERDAYLEQARKLNTSLGLPAESGLLEEALRAELERQDEQAAYYPDEPGYAEAQSRYEARLAELNAQDGSGRIAAFLVVRDAVVAARADFEAAVSERGLEPHSPSHVALRHDLENQLQRLRQQSPAPVEAALAYLDGVHEPYSERLRALEHQQRSEELAYSMAGRIGRAIEPVLRPMGFDWRIGTALVGAFAAKEVFVAQLGIVYAVGKESPETEALRANLRSHYTPLTAFCIMIFCLISTPCVATFAATRSESNSWKWPLFQLAGLTVLAWLVTTLIYQTGSLLGAV